ncbi:hypothetical protein J6590_058737 [Homalodisca vitripennis]|nr:hypothetical protein J6590_058737 [Homalodisca vitripennis]
MFAEAHDKELVLTRGRYPATGLHRPGLAGQGLIFTFRAEDVDAHSFSSSKTQFTLAYVSISSSRSRRTCESSNLSHTVVPSIGGADTPVLIAPRDS